MGDGTVDRRRFIGLGLVAAGGAAVVGPVPWTARASLCWESTHGFPGRPNALVFQAPDLQDGAEVEVSVSVHGPRGEAPLQTVVARVAAGEARIDAPMTYPHDERVAGAYRYVACARFRGAVLRTQTPATYTLRTWLPLS
jgi:hypothetical protein